jgi:hypothetical protein
MPPLDGMPEPLMAALCNTTRQRSLSVSLCRVSSSLPLAVFLWTHLLLGVP